MAAQGGPPAVTPPQRTYADAFLLAYSQEHVFYEFDMLLWAARTVSGKGRLAADTAEDVARLNNALVEALPVHLRNVIEFLFRGTPTPTGPRATYRGDPRPTDVAAKDFCTGAWAPPEIPQELVRAHERADWEIGHLTSSRLPAGDKRKAWDAEGLLQVLLPTMRLFVRTAAGTRRLAANVIALVNAQP